MIHEVTILVTCDTKGCRSTVEVTPEYTYASYSGSSGSYDTDDSAIQERIVSDHGWVVRGGKHYCGDMCAPKGTTNDEDE